MTSIPILRHVPHEQAGTIETALTGAGLTWHYMDLFREVPQQLAIEQLPGLIVMGGPMNVDETDRYPFLAPEVQWIRRAVDRGVPVLGVCLGSQLLAKALGARVYPMGPIATGRSAGTQPLKEIGWYQLELTPAAANDPLFAECCSQGGATVFQWHGDTFDLPDGATHLARSEVCRHQAFRYGDCAWGLQFHIEMTAEMIADWLGEPGNSGELAALGYIDPEVIRARTPAELPKLQSLARQVVGRFANLCRK